MKYVMFVCGDPDHTDADEAAAPPLEPWFEAARGVYEQGVRLQSIDDATVVRVRDGKLLVTDGPFTESKEIIGGWAILNTKTREEAVRIATEFMELHRKHWPEFEGESEVRPMFEPRMGP